MVGGKRKYSFISAKRQTVVQELRQHMEQCFSKQAGNLLTHALAGHGVSQSIFPQNPGALEDVVHELAPYHSISPGFV